MDYLDESITGQTSFIDIFLIFYIPYGLVFIHSYLFYCNLANSMESRFLYKTILIVNNKVHLSAPIL